MRSTTGASAEILRRARHSRVTLLANVALALEYEAICMMSEHRLASGLTGEEVAVFLDAVLAMVEPVETHFMWRPQLRDPADEFVLDTAVNGHATAIVTFNGRDFAGAVTMFGVACLTPAEVLKRLKA